MNEITISYKLSGFQKWFPTTVASISLLFGLYHCILEATNSHYNFNFYLALIVAISAAILLLNYTVWQPKPVITVNNESIIVNIPTEKKTPIIEWIEVKDLGIGVSHLNILLTDSKKYNVNLDVLKYKDLKKLKSKLIEICEVKKIPYHND